MTRNMSARCVSIQVPVDVLDEDRALYARVSSHDQQTLPLQIKTMREYALRRGWQTTTEI
ncbi:recombinase family protein [Tunturiibacter gelidoferens]|uniref:Site-specific integrase-resolvase n=1 Tax=Tunturiibacter gelidiferens TaxID=3069689 RepID=A0A9X0QHC3_9BACT|nr:putative site-specific integrase-resolvase [Edaphobacter lichenicola]